MLSSRNSLAKPGKLNLDDLVVRIRKLRSRQDQLQARRIEIEGQMFENGVWAWLWENAKFSLAELKEKIGSSLPELGLENKMKLFIGNRIIYPDGTVNSFVQRYLRDQVFKLFEAKRKRPVKKD